MSRNSVLNTPHNPLRVYLSGFKPLLAAVCLLAAATLHASPLPHLSNFETVGSGTMRFVGLRMYDATLWSPGGVWSASQPYALELVYARTFSGAAIAKRSIEEIARLRSFPAATLTRWEQQMRALFPDVKDGSRLTGVRIPGEGVSFYSGTRKLGQIDDETFADAFFGIWLSPSTRAPNMRAQLLKSP